MRIFTFIFVLMSLFAKIQAYEYELAICAISQNEGDYLEEWVEFHLRQGVQKIYLYDNLSKDDYYTVLRKYIEDSVVKIFSWPFDYSTENEWTKIQCDAYNHCVSRNGKKCKWIAFLDTDEFLFCPDKKNLRDFLKEYDECGAVQAHWVMYGTSHVSLPDGDNILKHLLYRAPDNRDWHRTTKAICKSSQISTFLNPHFAFLKDGTHGVDENKQNIYYGRGEHITFNKIRINHYWSRDEYFFKNIKLPRRQRWSNNVEEAIKAESEMNEIYDPILAEFY